MGPMQTYTQLQSAPSPFMHSGHFPQGCSCPPTFPYFLFQPFCYLIHCVLSPQSIDNPLISLLQISTLKRNVLPKHWWWSRNETVRFVLFPFHSSLLLVLKMHIKEFMNEYINKWTQNTELSGEKFFGSVFKLGDEMEHPETLPFAVVLKIPDISLQYGAIIRSVLYPYHQILWSSMGYRVYCPFFEVTLHYFTPQLSPGTDISSYQALLPLLEQANHAWQTPYSIYSISSTTQPSTVHLAPCIIYTAQKFLWSTNDGS